MSGENAWDVVWTLTYDEDADQLAAVGRQGTFHLERVRGSPWRIATNKRIKTGSPRRRGKTWPAALAQVVRRCV